MRPSAIVAVAGVVLAALLTGGASTADAADHHHRSHQPFVDTLPPIGWTSWSSLHQNISESIIEAQAKSLHDNLEAFGYRNVNVDAGWSNGTDAFGRDAPNTTKFPHGMATVARYVHSLGLRFGIYLVPGIPKSAVTANSPIFGTNLHISDIADTTRPGNTANDGSAAIDFTKPGAMAYVKSQADLLASWGVDYVKMDFVGPGGGRVVADNRADIQAWHTALQRTGRAIHLELSNSLSFANAATWARFSNGWRIEGDVECYSKCPGFLTNWAKVSLRFNDVPKWLPFAGPGHWNDLDSLEIGNADKDGITPTERQTQMTLWSIESAPLLLGTDMTKLDPADLAMLRNREVIAVDQAGQPAHPLSQATPQQVWFAHNRDGSFTVALFNLDAAPANVAVTWASLGITGPAVARDLWAHTNLGVLPTSFSANLAAHASMLLRVWPTHR